MLALLLGASAAGAVAGDDAIRAEYHAVWQRLVDTQVDVGDKETLVERSDDLGRAWQLMGVTVASMLARRPEATPAEIVAALDALNPDDRVGPCEFDDVSEDFFCRLQRFVVAADVLPLGGELPAFAVAVRYSYFGRLLVVSRNGVLASEPLGRCSRLHALPDAASGARRFFAFSRCDDWPTSCCGGGLLSVWRWDGREAQALVRRRFGAPRPGCTDDARWDRVLHRRGRWLKLYTRGGRFLGTSCSGGQLKRVWKIRVDREDVVDLGPHFVDPELEVADALLHRIDGHADVGKLATPAAAATVAALMTDSPYGFINSLRIWRAPGRSTLAIWLGPPDVVLTLTPRRGRLYVVDARPAEDADRPPLTGGNTATSSPSASR